jgi:23S rRNA pseudouridine2605 synthase
MIADGRVTVNGEPVTTPGTKIDPLTDTVAVDGAVVKASNEFVYIMLHKPEGVVTTSRDPQGRQTVLSLLPKDFLKGKASRVFPVGRLDYDTSGLLILTNDGDLAYRMTHPRHMVKKVYIAKLSGVPSGESAGAFKRGLMIDGRMTSPCGFNIIKRENGICTARIAIREGRNRQIRKMCAEIGCPVISLKRVEIGPLKLGGLPRGGCRFLSEKEAALLNECCAAYDIMKKNE